MELHAERFGSVLAMRTLTGRNDTSHESDRTEVIGAWRSDFRSSPRGLLAVYIISISSPSSEDQSLQTHQLSIPPDQYCKLSSHLHTLYNLHRALPGCLSPTTTTNSRPRTLSRRLVSSITTTSRTTSLSKDPPRTRRSPRTSSAQAWVTHGATCRLASHILSMISS